MKVAALYDVHGNLPALKAVVERVAAEGIDRIVFGGDYAWGPVPAETVAFVQGLEAEGAVVIRGNADREVATRAGEPDGLDAHTAAVNEWASDQLTREQRDWLATCPEQVELHIEGRKVLFTHACPRNDTDAIVDTTSEARLAQLFGDCDADVVVIGHTHLQFVRRWRALDIVNSGSVGLPFGEPGAYWAVIGKEVELRRTGYDYEAAGEMFLRTGGPEAVDFAEHVRRPPAEDVARGLWGDL
jgi:putative phosphoesterase